LSPPDWRPVLEGIVMCAPVTDEEREADVVRLLEQATLGPTESLDHDQGAKSALGGRLSLPPFGGAMSEVRTLIRTLVNHPNTPAFISRQLIQKTVTSSPTPQYVARVAKVFRDNGSGVRGDLAAVTRAILLDPEARGARKIDPEYGRLREPVLLWTAMIRALDVTTDGLLPQQQVFWSSQALFGAPTVFGYYPADYTLLGGSIPAPEFGIFSSSEYIYRVSEINIVLYGSEIGLYPSGLWAAQAMAPQPYVSNATGTPSPALTAFLADGPNPDVLVERLNRLFLHGTMDADMRSILVTVISKLPANDPHRVRILPHRGGRSAAVQADHRIPAALIGSGQVLDEPGRLNPLVVGNVGVGLQHFGQFGRGGGIVVLIRSGQRDDEAARDLVRDAMHVVDLRGQKQLADVAEDRLRHEGPAVLVLLRVDAGCDTAGVEAFGDLDQLHHGISKIAPGAGIEAVRLAHEGAGANQQVAEAGSRRDAGPVQRVPGTARDSSPDSERVTMDAMRWRVSHLRRARRTDASGNT
jgi:hypothetical protein